MTIRRRSAHFVRVGMHHDGDWFEPVAYREAGDILMQRLSGVQHTRVGLPMWLILPVWSRW
jgi:hypothetical protein